MEKGKQRVRVNEPLKIIAAANVNVAKEYLCVRVSPTRNNNAQTCVKGRNELALHKETADSLLCNAQWFTPHHAWERAAPARTCGTVDRPWLNRIISGRRSGNAVKSTSEYTMLCSSNINFAARQYLHPGLE